MGSHSLSCSPSLDPRQHETLVRPDDADGGRVGPVVHEPVPLHGRHARGGRRQGAALPRVHHRRRRPSTTTSSRSPSTTRPKSRRPRRSSSSPTTQRWPNTPPLPLPPPPPRRKNEPVLPFRHCELSGFFLFDTSVLFHH